MECDGGQHVDSAYDAERDAWFGPQGFRVLRIWTRRLLDEDERDGVVQELLALLSRR